MTHIEVIGGMAMIVQLAVVLMGYPLQIREMYKVPVVTGVPLLKWCIIILCHCLWMIYTGLRWDLPLFIPNIPGLVFAIWIAILIIKKSPQTEPE
jgi:uncharacterized protein with PQ loop repeat